MKITAMKTAAKSAFYKSSLKLRKNSPTILIIGGAVGVVAGTIMACRATLKAVPVIEEHKQRMNEIEEFQKSDIREERGYTEEVAAHDTFIVYSQTCVALAKLYAPAVIVEFASIAAIIGSHRILTQRNAALATAYTTLIKSFKNYRGRVIERFGETVDQELKTGVRKKKIEETEIDPETGKEKKVKTEAEVFDSDNLSDYSPYARFFDETCVGCWQKDAEYNLMFLRAQQKYFNDMLVAKGYVWLNQVYEALGIQITKEGQKIGWVYDPNDPELANYIDFGIYDICRPTNRKFVNGYERSILLDFNVDGDIWARMK